MPAKPKSKNARAKKREGDSPMPQGGAGLIRFYQDQSNGIKVGPITTIVMSLLLIVVVIVAHQGWMDFLLGA